MSKESGKPPTRAQFLGRGAFLLTGLLGAAAATTGCDAPPERAADDPGSMDALRAVNPKLVGYKEVGRYDIGMQEARGLASDSAGNAWVAGDEALACFDAEGKEVRRVALADAPRCVTVGTDGRVWAGLMDRVLWLDASFVPQAAGPVIAPRAHLTALAATAVDAWAADWGNLAVHRLDRTGAPVGRICEKDTARGYTGIVAPSPHMDVAVSGEGLVLVSNPGMHRIEAHTPEGRSKGAWGTASSDLDGFCGCCNPTDFALLPDGRVVTAEKGIPRVKLYDPKGKFLCVVAPPSDFASNAMGIDLAVGPDGRIIVLDIKARSVRVYLPGGRTA